MPANRAASIVLALAVAATGALGACTSGGKPQPKQSPGVIPDERVSTDNALPKEFPSDVPVLDGSTVVYSAVGPFGVSAYFSSERSTADVKGFLFDAFGSRGWVLAVCQPMKVEPEPLTIATFIKDKRVASVVVGYNPGYASRLEGKKYSFLVSVTDTSRPPSSTAKPC